MMQLTRLPMQIVLSEITTRPTTGWITKAVPLCAAWLQIRDDKRTGCTILARLKSLWLMALCLPTQSMPQKATVRNEKLQKGHGADVLPMREDHHDLLVNGVVRVSQNRAICKCNETTKTTISKSTPSSLQSTCSTPCHNGNQLPGQTIHHCVALLAIICDSRLHQSGGPSRYCHTSCPQRRSGNAPRTPTRTIDTCTSFTSKQAGEQILDAFASILGALLTRSNHCASPGESRHRNSSSNL